MRKVNGALCWKNIHWLLKKCFEEISFVVYLWYFFPIEHGVLYSCQAQHYWFSDIDQHFIKEVISDSYVPTIVSIPFTSHLTLQFLFSSHLALLTLCLRRPCAVKKEWMWPFTGNSLIFLPFLIMYLLGYFLPFPNWFLFKYSIYFCYFIQSPFPIFWFFSSILLILSRRINSNIIWV